MERTKTSIFFFFLVAPNEPNDILHFVFASPAADTFNDGLINDVITSQKILHAHHGRRRRRPRTDNDDDEDNVNRIKCVFENGMIEKLAINDWYILSELKHIDCDLIRFDVY